LLKLDSIRSYLRPYSITQRRKTTMNNAFASAIAENTEYDPGAVAKAIQFLNLERKGELLCFYCDRPSQTWDHVKALVKNGEYSGFGHTLGNLVPCCKDCNSKKGNKDPEAYLEYKFPRDKRKREHKLHLLKVYQRRYLPSVVDQSEMERLCPAEMRELERLKRRILRDMEKADEIAKTVRESVSVHRQRTNR